MHGPVADIPVGIGRFMFHHEDPSAFFRKVIRALPFASVTAEAFPSPWPLPALLVISDDPRVFQGIPLVTMKLRAPPRFREAMSSRE